MDDASPRRDETISLRGQVLALLRDHGPMPRVTLARRTGLSPTSITRLISQLIADDLVSEGATIATSRLGRPATEVALRRDSHVVVGLQIGVGFMAIGLFDVAGESISRSTLTYPAESTVERVLSTAAKEIERHLVGTERGHVLGIGVAAPGPVDPDGRLVMLPVNLTWRDAPVADILESKTGLPVRVESNVRSMALAEATFGGGRDLSRVAYVYLRTGLGAGLIVEGEPFSGGVYGAIEIGHLRTSARNIPCVCGGRGCLETVVSDAALRQRSDALGVTVDERGPLLSLWRAARRATERPDLTNAVQEVVEQLATGLSSLATLLNPQIIFLGGTLNRMPDDFLELLIDESRRSMFPLVRETIRVERSSLGMDAGALGAATAALQELFYS